MDDTAIREWIRARQVCWEVDPHREWRHAHAVPVGFDLSLFARVATLAEAAEVHGVLRGIVKQAVPEDPRVRVEIAPFRPSFRLQRETGWTPEVQLHALLEHRGDHWAPVGEAERACVARIESRLKALGARYGVWTRDGPAGVAA